MSNSKAANNGLNSLITKILNTFFIQKSKNDYSKIYQSDSKLDISKRIKYATQIQLSKQAFCTEFNVQLQTLQVKSGRCLLKSIQTEISHCRYMCKHDM